MPMKAPALRLLIPGVLCLLVGVVWALQGSGHLAGSVMSGRSQWLVIGVVVALIGLGLIALGWTRRTARV